MARRLARPDPKQSELIQDLASLGQLVRNRRLELALRIDDAAHASGITASMLSRLENGFPVGADRLLLVIRGLGLSMLVTTRQEGRPFKSLTMADLMAMGPSPGELDDDETAS
ncbi:MAG: helix-turn-helix domain-containing protein [Janthinobacterium lividum]